VTVLTAAELAAMVEGNPLGAGCSSHRRACCLPLVLRGDARKPVGRDPRPRAPRRRNHPQLGNDLEAPCPYEGLS
jgi:hypothetical protein